MEHDTEKRIIHIYNKHNGTIDKNLDSWIKNIKSTKNIILGMGFFIVLSVIILYGFIIVFSYSSFEELEYISDKNNRIIKNIKSDITDIQNEILQIERYSNNEK